MSARSDGGPAFPRVGTKFSFDAEGMSLRDYFAGHALAKCLEETWGDGSGAENAAIGAYQIADAMLAERSKVKP